MTDEEAMRMLTQICDHFGWSIGMPTVNEDHEVAGLIIGSVEFIHSRVRAEDVVGHGCNTD